MVVVVAVEELEEEVPVKKLVTMFAAVGREMAQILRKFVCLH